jgi:hypothetical protein
LYYEYSEDTLFEHALDLGLVNANTQLKKDDLVQLIYAHYTWPCEDEISPDQPEEDTQPPRKKQKTSKNVENTTQEQISRKTLNELAQQEGAIIINNPKRCKFSFI